MNKKALKIVESMKAKSRTQVTNEADTMLRELSLEYGKSEEDILTCALRLYKHVMELINERE